MDINEILRLSGGDPGEIEKAIEALGASKRYAALSVRYKEAKRANLLGMTSHQEWLRQQQEILDEILRPCEAAVCFYHEAIALTKAGENQGAINAFTKAIEQFPDYADAYLGRAIVRQNEYWEHGNSSDLHAAIRDLHEALASGTENCDNAYWNLSVAYIRMRDQKLARRFLKKIRNKRAFPEYQRLLEEIETPGF